MSDSQEEIERLIEESLKRGDVVGWFEELYAQAGEDLRRVPWVHMSPRKELVEWALQKQPDGRGRSALVIGCGVGDDAEVLAGLNYAVTAFDVSKTAIEWCRQRFPSSSVDYQTADLFAPPQEWLGAFDLVLEAYIVQALPPEMRKTTIEAVAAFVAPGGTLVAIGRGLDPCPNRVGPPWALFPEELVLYEAAGLALVQLDRNDDAAIAPVFRYRAEYKRPVGELPHE
jgi:SAM-dependent methyltransferase